VTAPPFPGRLDQADLSLPERPLVSIVIPTQNNERHIAPLLDSLDVQTYGPESLEIYVVDSESTDRTLQIVKAFPSRFARLDLIDRPGRDPAVGMNQAMRGAIGHCWLVIDASGDVDPDFVEQSVSALRRTAAACVGGAVETIGEGFVGSAIAAAVASPFGAGPSVSRDIFDEEDVDTVSFGCYHRKVWDLVGEFEDAAGEDGYAARVLQAGGRIVHVPGIRGSYYPSQTFDALARQYFRLGAAKGAAFSSGRVTQPRDFIPSAALIGAPLLFLLSRRFKPARWAARAAGSVYFSKGFKAAGMAAEGRGANTLVTFAAMVTMQVTYGAGFIKGAVMGRLRR